MNQVFQGDCRKIMRNLPASIADACITDPPYGDTSLDWDKQCQGWIAEVARVLKPASSVWVFGSMRFLAPLFAEFEGHGFRYSQDIVWEKHNGSGSSNDRFRRVHEHAVMFYRGAWSDVHHETQFTADAVARAVRRKQKPAHWGGVGESSYKSIDGGPRIMRSVLQVRSEHGRALHPTQKPIGIVMPLIKYSVPEGGVVIDPFFGSGTTGIAAEMTGRNWIGCELNPTYARLIKLRQQQMGMAL